MVLSYDFQPRQIVCLEHKHTRLYAEVIQVVESRQVCWVRPLILVQSTEDTNLAAKSPAIHDLRFSADLLWSRQMFRPALDTEVMPLLLQVWASEPELDYSPANQQQLNQFMHQVWQSGADS